VCVRESLFRPAKSPPSSGDNSHVAHADQLQCSMIMTLLQVPQPTAEHQSGNIQTCRSRQRFRSNQPKARTYALVFLMLSWVQAKAAPQALSVRIQLL